MVQGWPAHARAPCPSRLVGIAHEHLSGRFGGTSDIREYAGTMANSESELHTLTIEELAARAGVATTSRPPSATTSRPPSAPVPVTFSATPTPVRSTGKPVDREPTNAIRPITVGNERRLVRKKRVTTAYNRREITQ